MTKEELKKEAKEKWWNEDTVSGASLPDKIYITGYLAGAEPREKRIAELEKENAELKERIKEMRCCGNCRHFLEKNPQRCSYCFELCEWGLK